MRDKRRDSGEYYPGGRVIARPGTAPQQMVVQWSDVQNKPQVAPLPDRYREDDMKGKINEIASKFALFWLSACCLSTFGGITVQKATKGSLWNDDLVVVDVTGDSSSMTTSTVAAIATHAIETNIIVKSKLPTVLRRDEQLSGYTTDPAFEEAKTRLISWGPYDMAALPARYWWMWNGYVLFSHVKGMPTTLEGYGITDAYTKDETDGRIAKATPGNYSIVSNAALAALSGLTGKADKEKGGAKAVYWQPINDLIYPDGYGSITDGAGTDISIDATKVWASTWDDTVEYALDYLYDSIPDISGLAPKSMISANNPIFSNAVLAVTINTIRREVSSALNTYVDGETGVEYEGKFYGGSLYYVPTGNVYPPNN